MIDVRGVEICAESFGDPADPTILLVHGAQASMLWWPEALCEQIAAGGRHVIRFDTRDTGRSSAFPVGAPGYAMSDLADDAAGVLDGFGVPQAHVVGRSMGGGIALFLALDHPDRVLTVTLVTTGSGEDLDEGDDDEAVEAVEAVEADEADETGGPVEDEPGPTDWVEQAVVAMRGASGGSPYFDEDDVRDLARRDLARARDIETIGNHWVMDFDEPRGGGWSDLAVPTLVVQGEVDPWFPPAAGQALVDAIAGSAMVVMPSTGHDVPEPMWDVFVPALLAHTARA